MTTQSGTAVAEAIYDRLLARKDSLLLADVWFGDQNLLPTTPAACVIVGPTAVESVGAPRYVEATFEVQVLVYHCKIQDSQVTELECSQRAEAVQGSLNTAMTLNGLVLDSLVRSLDPGYIEKGQGQNWYRTTRVTFQAISRYQLPLEET